jgi:hypothetical protein
MKQYVEINITNPTYTWRQMSDWDEDMGEVERAILGIDISRFPMPMTLGIRRIIRPAPGLVTVEMMITARVRDRDGYGSSANDPFVGLEDPRSETFQVDRCLTDAVRRWVRGCLQELVLHELDECLAADGRRIFDPHLPPPLMFRSLP